MQRRNKLFARFIAKAIATRARIASTSMTNPNDQQPLLPLRSPRVRVKARAKRDLVKEMPVSSHVRIL